MTACEPARFLSRWSLVTDRNGKVARICDGNEESNRMRRSMLLPVTWSRIVLFSRLNGSCWRSLTVAYTEKIESTIPHNRVRNIIEKYTGFRGYTRFGTAKSYFQHNALGAAAVSLLRPRGSLVNDCQQGLAQKCKFPFCSTPNEDFNLCIEHSTLPFDPVLILFVPTSPVYPRIQWYSGDIYSGSRDGQHPIDNSQMEIVPKEARK